MNYQVKTIKETTEQLKNNMYGHHIGFDLEVEEYEYLIEQAAKVERYEKALTYLSNSINYMDRYFVLDHVVDIAERALEDKVLEELYHTED